MKSLTALVLVGLYWAAPAWAQPDGEVPVRGPEPMQSISEAELSQALGGPSLVTFSGKDVPSFDAVAALFKAGKLPEVDTPPPMPPHGSRRPVTVSWNKVPFWSAVAQFTKANGWHDFSQRGLTWLLTPEDVADLDRRLVVQTDWMRLLATGLSRTAATTLPSATLPAATLPAGTQAPEAKADASLALTLFLDPRLPAHAVDLHDCQVQLGNGGALSQAVSMGSGLGGNSEKVARFQLQLPPGLKAGTVISRVTGKVGVTLMVSRQEWKGDDLLLSIGQTQLSGTAQFTLKSAQIGGDELQVSFTMISPKWDYDAETVNRALESLHLRDAGGVELTRLRNKSVLTALTNAQRQFRLDAAFSAPSKPGPVSFDWDLPAPPRLLELPFEIRDLVVP